MRRIPLCTWKATGPQGEVEETTLTALNAIINSTRPEDMPRGVDNFRLFLRLAKAFAKAEETDILELEETDYSMIKQIIERSVPAIWAMNQDIKQAIQSVLDAQEVT